MAGRFTIDETHDMIVEPGPYPPGEGPLDYAECVHGCDDWSEPCRGDGDE